ncbi:MAG: hypothetical protein M1827_004707 [Pycnora praestabilis]|nr:MAG: hypothetical protein M1827_004707 [Pycnora praestabilis]
MAAKLPASMTVDAQPCAFTFPPRHTALLLLDQSRSSGTIANEGTPGVYAKSVKSTNQLQDLFRSAGLHVIHTRVGTHPYDFPQQSDPEFRTQQDANDFDFDSSLEDDEGEDSKGGIKLESINAEVVVNYAGSGPFWGTTLMEKLRARALTHLVVGGSSTVQGLISTVQEARDRGFQCCTIEEAITSSLLDAEDRKKLTSLGYVTSLESFANILSPYSVDFDSLDENSLVWDGDLSISSLSAAYRRGLSLHEVINTIYSRIEAYHKIDPAVWIYLEPKESVLQAARNLGLRFPDRRKLPYLFGIPISVKDSIDISHLPTTTACPPLSTIPTTSAPIYELVIDHGALFIGKTNMEQLATGMTGCRSPFGTPHSVYSPHYIAGGSSSGSAVSVGASLVSFSLGSDTAGSGRVPAAFNGIVGFKPTKGTVSARGITPACASMDCVALLTRNVEDARTVWHVVEGFDEEDVHAKPWPHLPPSLVPAVGVDNFVAQFRFNFGIPPPKALAVCSAVYRRMFDKAVQTMQSIGGVLTSIDWTPFEKAGKLLYEGTFVLERLAGLPDGWLEENREHLHPVTREVFEGVSRRGSSAVEVFRDLHAMQRYTRQTHKTFSPDNPNGISILLVPTIPTHWTIDQVNASPIQTNTVLGDFAHFGNVLDLVAVALPAGVFPKAEMEGRAGGDCRSVEGTEVEKNGVSVHDGGGVREGEEVLPFGVTLLGGTRQDAEVLELARRFEERCPGTHPRS